MRRDDLQGRADRSATPILTAAEMREADRRAIDELAIPDLVLMENAARGAFDVLRDLLDGDVAGRSIAILCGPGNNGGDALGVARHALIHGAEVTCVLLAEPGRLSGNAAAELAMLDGFGPERVVPWESFRHRSGSFDVIVDGMLGTGAEGPLRSPYDDAVAWANRRPGIKLALDIPTGINADTGLAGGEAFLADGTATMAALKPGLLLNQGAECSGVIHIVHIGAPPGLYEKVDLALLDESVASAGLPDVRNGWNKYDRGKVLVLAGSRGMGGAGAMAAHSALRSGSGLVIYGMPEAAAAVLAGRIEPEIMTRFLPAGDDGAFAADALDAIAGELSKYSAIAAGPGMSKSDGAARMTRALLERSRAPLVLDADGLGSFAGCPDELRRNCPLVITPHHGEMGRLIGLDSRDVGADPIGVARMTAARIDGVVVLKGAPTIVALPDGRAWINAAGNPGMATGGTGDILTGTIASLIGQTGDVVAGTLSAVYLHSLAGDLAARTFTEHGMTATDIISHIPQAYRILLDQ